MFNLSTIDPNSAFDAEHWKLAQACGFLLPWASIGATFKGREAMQDYVEQSYGFPIALMTGGTVCPTTGRYRYPGDPDLWPLAKVCAVTNATVCYIYEYGIIAFVYADGETAVYRMD